MTRRPLRWSVTIGFEVDGESLELALEAVRQALRDFPRLISSVSLTENRWEALSEL